MPLGQGHQFVLYLPWKVYLPTLVLRGSNIHIVNRMLQLNIPSHKPVDGNWVSTFVVPWERFAPGIRQACAQKKRPKHSDRLDMVRKVCEAVSLYTRLPGRAALQNIARKVVSQYPESFKDYMGDSSETAAKRFLGLIYVRNVSESHVMVFTRSGSLKAFRGTILLWV